jgi:hypothetical protein
MRLGRKCHKRSSSPWYLCVVSPLFLIGALLLLCSLPPSIRLSKVGERYSVAVVAASESSGERRVKPYREQHDGQQQQQQSGSISDSQQHFILVQYCTS